MVYTYRKEKIIKKFKISVKAQCNKLFNRLDTHLNSGQILRYSNESNKKKNNVK